MKLIDLSVSINETMPVYPGDPSTEIKPAGNLSTDGYEDHYLCIGTHAGTHIDSPRHMLEGGKGLDQFSVETFTGRGVYIKVENNQFDLESIKQTDIQKADIVLFHTGMDELYSKPEYFENYPAIPEIIAHYLVEKQIKMVGVDTCSVDQQTVVIHKLLLQNDILILENLTNLASLKDKQFTIYAFPLKLSLDGSPIRVVAEIKE